jgi:HPt (histidine-containing phosphotransfer) domain-containing protein
MASKGGETLDFPRRRAAMPEPAGQGRRLDRLRRPAIDREHLDQQTFGNHELQREVLRLFLKQLAEQVALIAGTDDLGVRREAAHTLAGAALGVGAFSVAAIASEIERAQGPVVGRLKALDAAAEAVRHFIADFLRD